MHNFKGCKYHKLLFKDNVHQGMLFKNLSSVAWFKAIISSITVTDMIPSLHYEPITAWKLIHGLSALFGFGHWLFESVNCGGKGYPKLLQAGAQKSKKTSVFFLEMGRRGGFWPFVREEMWSFCVSGLDCSA